MRSIKIIAAGCALYGALWLFTQLVLTLQMHEIDTQYTERWRPTRIEARVSRCPGDASIWECVRHAMYRKDI